MAFVCCFFRVGGVESHVFPSPYTGSWDETGQGAISRGGPRGDHGYALEYP
jgi:hypothetical protein